MLAAAVLTGFLEGKTRFPTEENKHIPPLLLFLFLVVFQSYLRVYIPTFYVG